MAGPSTCQVVGVGRCMIMSMRSSEVAARCEFVGCMGVGIRWGMHQARLGREIFCLRFV